MKTNFILKALPLALLMFSCGGEESSSTDSKTKTEETFGSTFEDCSGENNINYTDAGKNEGFATDAVGNVNFTTFEYYGGEITKDKNSLSIKFTNNKNLVNKSIPSYGPGDLSFTMRLKMKSGVLEAGEYTDDNSDISLTRWEKIDGTSKTASIGSNKTAHFITLNSIDKKHACGSYSLQNEAGDILFSINFDTDIETSMW